MSRLPLALLLALALLAAAGPARSAKPETVYAFKREPVREEFSCGFPVANDFVISATFTFRTLGDGRTVGLNRYHAQGTYTNLDTGESVAWSWAGAFTVTDVVEKPDGTTTFTQVRVGLFPKIAGPGGGTALQEVGRIVTRETVDFRTGEFVSSEIVWEAGRHPLAEAGDDAARNDALCGLLADVIG